MISRYVVPMTGAALLFVAALVIMLFAMPGELRPVDYFLTGTVATLIGCVGLFLGVVRISRLRDVFYKKRK